MPLVEIRNLAKRFGGLTAVFDLDLDIEPGVIQGLIGPNGAGKTTTLNMLGGSLFPTKGEITFKGKDITRLSPYQRAQRGIARVFQHDVLFSSFTVLENILVAFHLQSGTNVGEILFGGASTLRRKKAMRHKAMELLHFVGLDSLADEPAINLPHGNQRLLGLAIALATQPQLLLLDEPVTGMNAEEVASMLSVIRTVRDEKGITAVLVEHNVKAVMSICDRICVLSFGRKLSEGLPKEIAENPAVIEAYLGAEQDVA